MNNGNIRIFLIPHKAAPVCGGCRKSADGYIICIDESLSRKKKCEVLQHELTHIKLNHLDDDTKTEWEKEQEVAEHIGKVIQY